MAVDEILGRLGRVFVERGVKVWLRVYRTCSNRRERSMSTLAYRHVLAGSKGGIVRCVSVIRGHGMPEGAPCLAQPMMD